MRHIERNPPLMGRRKLSRRLSPRGTSPAGLRARRGGADGAAGYFPVRPEHHAHHQRAVGECHLVCVASHGRPDKLEGLGLAKPVHQAVELRQLLPRHLGKLRAHRGIIG
jgi:hypothetical protein